VSPQFFGENEMDVIAGVQTVLDETLSLGKRAYTLKLESELLGVIPELDSQAVLSVLLGLEEHFCVVIDDDEIEVSLFENVGGLVGLIESKLDSG